MQVISYSSWVDRFQTAYFSNNEQPTDYFWLLRLRELILHDSMAIDGTDTGGTKNREWSDFSMAEKKITIGSKDSLEVALSSHTCFYGVVFSLWCFHDFCLFVVQTVKTPIYNFVFRESWKCTSWRYLTFFKTLVHPFVPEYTCPNKEILCFIEPIP